MKRRSRSEKFVKLIDDNDGAWSYHIDRAGAEKQAFKWAGKTGEHSFSIIQLIKLCARCKEGRVIDKVCGTHGSVEETREVPWLFTIKIVNGFPEGKGNRRLGEKWEDKKKKAS